MAGPGGPPQERLSAPSACSGDPFELLSARSQYLASLGVQSRVQQGATQGRAAHKLMDALKDTDVLHWKHSLAELIEISLAQTTSIWRMYGKRSEVGPL